MGRLRRRFICLSTSEDGGTPRLLGVKKEEGIEIGMGSSIPTAPVDFYDFLGADGKSRVEIDLMQFALSSSRDISCVCKLTSFLLYSVCLACLFVCLFLSVSKKLPLLSELA
jgi:hypothetical protein